MPELTDSQVILKFFLTPNDPLEAKRALLTEIKALSESDKAWFAQECRKYV